MKHFLYICLLFFAFGTVQAQSISDSRLVPQVWTSPMEDPYADLDKYTLVDIQSQVGVTRLAGDQIFVEREETIANLDNIEALSACVEVFPNPVVDYATITWEDFGNGDDRITVQIVDAQGKVFEEILLERYIKQAELNFADYPSGIYFVHILTGDTACNATKIEVSGY